MEKKEIINDVDMCEIYDKESPSTLEKIKLLPCVFKKPGKVGDFSWMLRRSKYNDVLFLFNDNQEQFEAFLEYKRSGEYNELAESRGGGNAVIRPYQLLDPPRAAGIPTGSNGKGYIDLNKAKPYIDDAISNIKNLINTGFYKRIAYSAEEDRRTLGSSIYIISDDVKEYIVSSLESLLE